MTAYGLAVRRGFKGTLDDWLASLVGPPGPPGTDPVAIAAVVDEKMAEKKFVVEGSPLTQDLNAAGFRITGLPEPEADTDAATKAFLAGYVAATALTKDGGKLTGALTLRGIYLTEGEDYFHELPEHVPEGKLIFVEAGV